MLYVVYPLHVLHRLVKEESQVIWHFGIAIVAQRVLIGGGCCARDGFEGPFKLNVPKVETVSIVNFTPGWQKVERTELEFVMDPHCLM